MMQLIFEDTHGNDEVYMDCLRAICGDTEGKSMVDLCCNLAPHTPKLGYSERLYIDVLPRVLDHHSEQKYFMQENIFTYLFESNESFNTVILSDAIEHVTKKDGWNLINGLPYNKSREKIVVFTPLGEYMVEGGENPENHHSGWWPTDFDEDMPVKGKGWANIVFPIYHPTLGENGIGAFFAFWSQDIKQDFERVKNELKTKTWNTLS